jgi:hypothetical protein
MIDAARHFQPVCYERNLNAMASMKMNVFLALLMIKDGSEIKKAS